MHQLKSSTLIVIACAMLVVSIAAQQPTPQQQGRGGRGRGGEQGAPARLPPTPPAVPGAPAQPYAPLAASPLADPARTYYGRLRTPPRAREHTVSKLARS